jgi:hypothetical protein
MTTPNIRLEDDTATVPFVAKNGYYIVGNKNFNFKFNALMHATQTQQDVQWEFNTAQFRALDWRTPLQVDIRSLYQQRAQQLRDRYDYLMLCFSGGSDSTTILKSFINNNIHLDEIICDWPLAHTSNWSVSRDPTPFNHMSEWELAIRPMLDHVRTHHPRIKITITDTTQDLSVEDTEHTFTISHMGPYQSTKRYKNVAERFGEINQKHSGAAVIMGCDKPHVFIDRGVFCTILADQHCFFKSSHVPDPRVVEYFFWSSDMPEIAREQAHLIYQHLLARPQLRLLFDEDKSQYSTYRTELIKSIIYPDWDRSIFQANKAESTLWSSQHAWILKEKTPALDAWQSVLTSHLNTVAPKYLNFYPGSRRVHSVKSLYSRAFPIGIMPKQNSTSALDDRYIIA